MDVKIPFFNDGRIAKPDGSFLEMLHNRICPNFQIGSISSVIIFICLVVFLLSRIAYSPGGYSQFLQSPTQMRKFALDVELNKSNKIYYYQTITSIFLHQSWSDLIGNVFFALIILYELQYCWRPSILIGLLAGVAANSVALATEEGILMGPSGFLCACVGIQIASLILHCSYLRAQYQKQFYIMGFFCVFLVIMIIGMGSRTLVNLFGFIYGLLFGAAIYPRMPQANINQNIDKLLKIFSLGFLGLAILLGLVI